MIKLTVNDRAYDVDADADTPLLYVLAITCASTRRSSAADSGSAAHAR